VWFEGAERARQPPADVVGLPVQHHLDVQGMGHPGQPGRDVRDRVEALRPTETVLGPAHRGDPVKRKTRTSPRRSSCPVTHQRPWWKTSP
jgi:hypothetical protein